MACFGQAGVEVRRVVFFFFQAEDGIRDSSVTGVQTCALPISPLIVQGTYIVAFAILVEAALSFLGVGLPPDIPTWGNIMAEGRVQFVSYPQDRKSVV